MSFNYVNQKLIRLSHLYMPKQAIVAPESRGSVHKCVTVSQWPINRVPAATLCGFFPGRPPEDAPTCFASTQAIKISLQNCI